MKKSLYSIFCLIQVFILNAQEDRASFNDVRLSIDLYLSNGFYNAQQIDNGRYHIKNIPLSWGLTFEACKNNTVSFIAGLNLTQSTYFFKDYDPARNYADTPNLNKDFAVMDFEIGLGYSFINKGKYSLKSRATFVQGNLIKGKDEVTGIFDNSYYINNNRLAHEQFNTSMQSLWLGLNNQYAFLDKLAVTLNCGSRIYLSSIEPEAEKLPPSFHIQLGLSYFLN